NGLVRRVPAHPDAHHPRHPYQQDPVHPEPREPATHGNDGRDHALRRVAAVVTARSGARHDAPAAPRLATRGADAPRLRGADASREGVAASSSVDLSRVWQGRPWQPRGTTGDAASEAAASWAQVAIAWASARAGGTLSTRYVRRDTGGAHGLAGVHAAGGRRGAPGGGDRSRASGP